MDHTGLLNHIGIVRNHTGIIVTNSQRLSISNMGLGANEDGHCSMCDVDHLRPWGNGCLAYKDALVKCSDLNIDPSEYKLYLDLNLVRYAKDLPDNKVKDENKPELSDQVKSLTESNAQQRRQIQSLLHQLAEKTKFPQNTQSSIDHDKSLQQVTQRLDKMEQDREDVLMRILDRLDTLESKGNIPLSPDIGRKRNPSPSDFTQLSDSIHQLSLSVGKDAAQPKGTELKPEYYVHVLTKGGNVKNMSLLTTKPEELIYGMLGVYDNLMATGGDARGYFAHLIFVARHLMERNFTVAACAKYDKYVVDQVVSGKSRFSDFNPVAAGLFLHGGAAVRAEPAQQQWGPKQTPGRQLRDCNRENTPAYMPDWWPTDICFLFNARSCYGRCSKQHICGHCKMNHRYADCKFARRDGQGYGNRM